MFADPFDTSLAKVVRMCGHSLEGDGVRLHDTGTVVAMGKCRLLLPALGNQLFFQLILEQKVHNSLRVLNRTCTARGAVA